MFTCTVGVYPFSLNGGKGLEYSSLRDRLHRMELCKIVPLHGSVALLSRNDDWVDNSLNQKVTIVMA